MIEENWNSDQAQDSLISSTADPVRPAPQTQQMTLDVRSREAFELLKLGEAICGLQADQRSLRLEKEELRFERDRYRASAAEMQIKLSQALDQLDRAQVDQHELTELRKEVYDIARDFEMRMKRVREEVVEIAREFEEQLSRQENEPKI